MATARVPSLFSRWDVPSATVFSLPVGDEDAGLQALSVSAWPNGYPRITYPGKTPDAPAWYVAVAFNRNQWLSGGPNSPQLSDYADIPCGSIRPDGRPDFHTGEDWNGVGGGNTDQGEEVRAIADGLVLLSKQVGGYGNMIILAHRLAPTDELILSVYAHLQPGRRPFRPGDVVTRNEPIAAVGASGLRANAAHLHFELRRESFIRFVSPDSFDLRNPLEYSPGMWPACHQDTGGDNGQSFIAQHYLEPSAFLKASAGAIRWRYSLGAPVGSSPAQGSDGTIYFGASDGGVYAVDPTTGAPQWVFATGGPVWSSPAVGSDGTMFIGSDDDHVYAIDYATGDERWRFQTSGPRVTSTPALGALGTIYVASSNGQGTLHALDSSTGAERWRFQMGFFSSSAVVGRDGTVYVTGGTGGGPGTFFKVYALDGVTGTTLWEFDATHLQLASTPVLVNGRVYIGGGQYPYETGTLYALDATTGNQLWSLSVPGYITSSLVVGPHDWIFFGASRLTAPQGGSVLSVDPATQSLAWRFDVPTCVYATPAIGAGDIVYVPGCDGVLYALDAATGEKHWELLIAVDPPPTGFRESSPLVASDGTVYFGLDHEVVAVQTASAGLAAGAWPMFQRDVRHTGREH